MSEQLRKAIVNADEYWDDNAVVMGAGCEAGRREVRPVDLEVSMKTKVTTSLKQSLVPWLIKKLLGRKSLKSPVDVLWNMIDEENSKGTATSADGEPVPDCIKIEAWEEAADRISRECFGKERG